MLTAKKLRKEFASGTTRVRAVDGVTLQVPTGAMAAIIGKSGSGKSTLLALLGALDSPTDGSITVDDQEVTRMHGKQLLLYRRTTIGFVFQNYNLVPNLSALENVLLPMEFAGVRRTQGMQRAQELLEQVGLRGAQHKRRPAKLSGGEQQRVAIARALANTPRLVLADEPTGNLDSQTGKRIVNLLRSLAQSEKTTIVTVTHDEGVAKEADVVFRLADGKVVP